MSVKLDAGELRAQHERLQTVLSALSAALSDPAECASFPTREIACALLCYLQELLPKHFELEERGGYFSEAAAAAPHLSRRIEELQVDHLEFVARANELVELAQNARSTPVIWDSVAKRLEELTQQLRLHENAENELILIVSHQDLGGGA